MESKTIPLGETELPKSLTVQQAIEQGYTHYLYPDRGWQGLNSLATIEAEDFERGEIELTERESYNPSSSMDEAQILEMIGEWIWEQFSEETGCDTDEITDAISSIDHAILKPLMDAIEDKLKTCNYYRSSGIRLVPNTSSNDKL